MEGAVVHCCTSTMPRQQEQQQLTPEVSAAVAAKLQPGLSSLTAAAAAAEAGASGRRRSQQQPQLRLLARSAPLNVKCRTSRSEALRSMQRAALEAFSVQLSLASMAASRQSPSGPKLGTAPQKPHLLPPPPTLPRAGSRGWVLWPAAALCTHLGSTRNSLLSSPQLSAKAVWQLLTDPPACLRFAVMLRACSAC